jgi:hypothetical protein
MIKEENVDVIFLGNPQKLGKTKMGVVSLMKNRLKCNKSKKIKKSIIMQREATRDLIFTCLDWRCNPIIGCGPRYEHA